MHLGDSMDGKEIQRYRINAVYTQKELGEALGFHGHTAEIVIQQWESGRRHVPLKHLRKLHELIRIPYEKIIP